MSNYLLVLSLTLVIEVVVAIVFGIRQRRGFLAVFLVNIVTHPLLHLLLIILSYFSIPTVNDFVIYGLEIIVVLAEGYLLSYALHKRFKSMLLLSLLMNAASFFIGRYLLLLIN